MSKGLVLRIFQHCIDEGWIVPGQTTVLDPFNGVGGTAYGALLNGCDYLGLELEPHFFDMSHGCDCTGMTAAEYRRYYGRFKRVAYKDRHICPRCLNELEQISRPESQPRDTSILREKARKLRARLNAAKKAAVIEYHARKGLPKPTRLQLKRNVMIVEPIPFPEYHIKPARQVSMFELVEPDTLAYERNSGRIPIRAAHHYEGNVERWQKVFGGKNKAVVLQGDSRFLIDRLREAGVLVEGVVSISSPPYAQSLETDSGIDTDLLKSPRRSTGGSQAFQSSTRYGQSPGQLGAMSIGSPPFADSIGSDDPDKRGGLYADPKRRGDKNLTAEYGSSQGQLGGMATGEPVVSIGSPPFKDSVPQQDKTFSAPHDSTGYLKAEYGNSPAQLANLPSGQPPTVSIGSPPFSTPNNQPTGQGQGVRQDYKDGKLKNDSPDGSYGETQGQLGTMPTGDVISIGSPAFAGNSGGQGSASSEVFDDKDLFRRHSGGMVGGLGYGETDGQMGVMKPGVSVGSPPFENQGACQDPNYKSNRINPGGAIYNDYGTTPNQLGNQSGDTFWSASSLIIAQLSYLVTHSVWVTKNYLKDGKLVDFTGQWIACCEAHGFELVHHHKAYQLQEKGVKVDFEGEAKAITKGGVSFFRGLVNRKHKEAGNDELVIEAEDVLCFVNRRFNG